MAHRPFSTFVRVFKVIRQDECWIGVLTLDLMFTLFVRDNRRSNDLSKVVLDREARAKIIGPYGRKIYRIVGLSSGFSYIKSIKPRNRQKMIMKCTLLNNIDKFINVFKPSVTGDKIL